MKPDLSALRPLRAALVALPLGRSRWLPPAAALVALAALLFVALPLAAPPDSRGEAPAPPPSAAPTAPGDGSSSPPSYSTEYGSVPLVAEPDWPALLLDLGGKLLLTLGLVYSSLYLLRKYVGRAGGQRQASAVAVVETVPLGQHRSLHLVRVGNKHVLLGATQSQISFLTEILDLATPAPTDVRSAALAVGPTFADHLRVIADTAPATELNATLSTLAPAAEVRSERP